MKALYKDKAMPTLISTSIQRNKEVRKGIKGMSPLYSVLDRPQLPWDPRPVFEHR